MNIIIRTDGNQAIGIGHIMRCLSLGEELRRSGARVVFALSDDRMLCTVAAHGFRVYNLECKWNDYSEGVEKLLTLANQIQADTVITDSYYASDEYFLKVHRSCKSVCITENFPEPDIVGIDVFINYNYYMNSYAPTHENYRMLLGSQYALIREDFRGIVAEGGDEILILAGGSDPHNIAEKILSALSLNLLSGERIAVISGSLNFHIATLRSACDRANAVLYKNVANMAARMRKAKIAISAGGSTLYELCACGVPTIAYTFVDNQLQNVAALAQAGIIMYAGDFRDDEQKVIANIISMARKLLYSRDERHILSKSMQEVCDGFGPQRVSTELLH